MDEKKLTADNELKETIDKLLSDTGILIQIVSKLQDMRFEYLTSSLSIDTSKYEADLDQLNDKLQMIEILG